MQAASCALNNRLVVDREYLGIAIDRTVDSTGDDCNRVHILYREPAVTAIRFCGEYYYLDAVQTSMVHVVTCPLPPTAVDTPLVLGHPNLIVGLQLGSPT